jgi:hypothetical protein
MLAALHAQEFIRPLGRNINFIYPDLKKNGNAGFSQQNKTMGTSVSLPFLDDFYYATSQSYADTNLWIGKSAYINTGHGIAPPSIGVATFDGLNMLGYPHTPGLTNMSQSLYADTLTSRPINLYTRNTLTLQPSDSVALTLYYQARGNGDWPELTDSLLVEFYMPLAPIYTLDVNNNPVITGYGQWQNVWYHRGNPDANTNDTIFRRAYIPVADTAYFHDGFQFRIRNRATTAGDFDQWHVDYVFLDFHRAVTDTAYDDISIGYVPTPLLARYSAMPWQQYVPAERANYQSVFIRNNNNLDVPNMSYESRMYDPLGALTYSYNGGAINNLKPFRSNGWSNAAPHAHPAFTHTFAPFTDSIDYKMVHYIYRSGAGDFITNNDTVVQYQRFRNYFAFDDGSAEAAYYISGSAVQIVEKITLNVPDTLRAVRIYFDPVGGVTQAANDYSFQLVVYKDGGTGLPTLQLYQDSLTLPKYLKAGPNVIPEYTLTTPQVYAPGDYYIGIKQKPANIDIGIGFDRNLDHSQSLFYQNNGGGWTQSGIRGSLMMRPVFGKKVLSPTAGIHELSAVQAIGPALIYPNPASNMLYVNCRSESKLSYAIMNLMGQTLAEEPLEKNIHQVNTTALSEGVYILVLKSDKQVVQSQRIVIQR